MPACWGASGSVRTSRNAKSACWACVVQTFCPLMIHSSPSRTAFVFKLARSEPESGSENPWHHVILPCRMPGMNSFFCSSVPHCRIVGPTSVSPKKSARIGAPALANSSLSTTNCKSERPLPPYSTGQPAQIHPPEKSVSVQDWLNSLRASSVIEKSDENQPSGRFSSSQARTSPRNASASSGYVRSIDGSVAKAREVLPPFVPPGELGENRGLRRIRKLARAALNSPVHR